MKNLLIALLIVAVCNAQFADFGELTDYTDDSIEDSYENMDYQEID